MTQIPNSVRLLIGVSVVLGLCFTFTPAALAAWSSNGSGGSSALSYTMPTGSQPTTSVSGTSVALRWPAALFPDNKNVAGYVISRFNAINGGQGTVGAGCSGIVTTTTCVELNVPAGTWIYMDTPVQDNWTGGQSPGSSPATVT